MHLSILINSVVCLVGAIAGAAFALGSIISIANMKVAWASWLLGAAVLVPVAFVVAGVGAWLADSQGADRLVIAMIALPWVYGLAFVAAMLVSFRQ